MNIKEFENKRWIQKTQTVEFRHKEALKLLGDGSVLDVGCGDGLFLDLLKEMNGIAGVGVDISEEAVLKTKNRGFEAFLSSFADKLPFGDNSFDNVVMLDVLEHTYDPVFLMSEAKRISRKNIIIGVPNFNSLPARIQVLLGKVPENNLPRKGHLYWFNLNVLKNLAKEIDFQIESVRANTFGHKFYLSRFFKLLLRIYPGLFALSFVVLMRKGN